MSIEDRKQTVTVPYSRHSSTLGQNNSKDKQLQQLLSLQPFSFVLVIKEILHFNKVLSCTAPWEWGNMVTCSCYSLTPRLGITQDPAKEFGCAHKLHLVSLCCKNILLKHPVSLLNSTTQTLGVSVCVKVGFSKAHVYANWAVSCK